MKFVKYRKNLCIIFNLFILLICLSGCDKEVISESVKESNIDIYYSSELHSQPIPTVEPLSIIEARETYTISYPTAVTIYTFLSCKMQLSDPVCAGILGNMMAETGGQTLDIQWDIGSDYYGICQWSTYYNPDIIDANLSDQLNYLSKTINGEFAIFGYKYKEDFDYVDFKMLDDCREAALAFAQVYERCYHEYYEIRQDNAEVAYDFIEVIRPLIHP